MALVRCSNTAGNGRSGYMWTTARARADTRRERGNEPLASGSNVEIGRESTSHRCGRPSHQEKLHASRQPRAAGPYHSRSRGTVVSVRSGDGDGEQSRVRASVRAIRRICTRESDQPCRGEDGEREPVWRALSPLWRRDGPPCVARRDTRGVACRDREVARPSDVPRRRAGDFRARVNNNQRDDAR